MSKRSDNSYSGPFLSVIIPAYNEAVRLQGIPTATGRFGAMMQVELVNDGPVTLIVDREC